MLRSLLAPLLCPGSFFYSHCSSRHRPLFFVGTAAAAPAEKLMGYLEVPAGVTPLPMFPSSSSTAKNWYESWLSL